MSILIKRSANDFTPCPPGTWPAVCVDAIDLGPVHNEWKGEMVHKVRLVWQINERMPDGRPYLVSRSYTASLHEKSSLRKDLSSWRGMDFRPEELAGFDLENVVGVGCMLSVVQQPGNDGQPYSNVVAVMRIPQGYEAPRPDGYVRTIHRQDGQQPQQQPMRNPQNFQRPQPFQRPMQQPVAPRAMQPPQAQGWAPPETQTNAPAFFQQPVQQPVQQPPPPYPEEVTDDDIPF